VVIGENNLEIIFVKEAQQWAPFPHTLKTSIFKWTLIIACPTQSELQKRVTQINAIRGMGRGAIERI
jgi:hypothetical protein